MIVYRNDDDSRREMPVPCEGGWTLRSWHRYRVGGWAESRVTQDRPWATEEEVVERIRASLGHDESPADSYIGTVRVLAEAIDVETPTEGWPEAVHWQAPEGSPEIEVGQVWYHRGRAARVEAIGPMHPHGILGMLVRYCNPNPGVGSSMHRTPSANWYAEEHFRQKFTPTDEPRKRARKAKP